MKLTILKSIALTIIASSSMSVMATDTIYKTDTSTNPVEAIAHIPIVGLKVAGGAAALPLMIVGEIGNLSGQAGESLWEAAKRPIGDINQPSTSRVDAN